jgi:hypothetical protein
VSVPAHFSIIIGGVEFVWVFTLRAGRRETKRLLYGKGQGINVDTRDVSVALTRQFCPDCVGYGAASRASITIQCH